MIVLVRGGVLNLFRLFLQLLDLPLDLFIFPLLLAQKTHRHPGFFLQAIRGQLIQIIRLFLRPGAFEKRVHPEEQKWYMDQVDQQ